MEARLEQKTPRVKNEIHFHLQRGVRNNCLKVRGENFPIDGPLCSNTRLIGIEKLGEKMLNHLTLIFNIAYTAP
jgi:hypothetical protein